MNIVEVQDNLKNFSQDQLINEINQPSGMVPQFLVLTELGRRNRIKQDMEGRQAQNQPTVAQEVVSAAGVPQGGIMDMARSMAPKSSIEQNDAVMMMKEGGKPKYKNRMDMLLAYLRSLGADEEEEVKEATGGRSIAEIINFGGDFRPVKKNADGGVVKMFQGGIGGLSTNANDFGGLTIPLLEGALSQSDLEKQRLAEEEAKRKKELERFLEKQKPKYKGGALPGGSQTDTFGLLGAEKKVVNGEEFYVFPTGKVYDKNGRSVQGGMAMEVIKRAQLDGSDFQYSPTGTFGFYGENPDGSTNEEDFTPYGGLDIGDLTTPDPLVNLGQGTKNLINTVTDTVAPSIPNIVDGTADITNVDNTLTSFNPPRPSTDAVNLMKINQPEVPDELMIGAFGDIVRPDELQMPEFNNTPIPPFLPSGSGDMPDELMVPFDNTPTKGKGSGGDGDGDGKGGGGGSGGTKGGSAVGALESEIANMLKQNEEDREQDKYLALAKMGLALMSSSQPTFGGALGEAGMAGLDDLQASKQSYRDDKLALLDAQRKLEQARATAAAKDKSGLTGTNVVSSLNNIRNQKAKAMSDLAAIAPQFEGGTLTKEQEAAAEMFRRQIANLTVMESTYEAMLGGIGSLASSGVDLNATAN